MQLHARSETYDDAKTAVANYYSKTVLSEQDFSTNRGLSLSSLGETFEPVEPVLGAASIDPKDRECWNCGRSHMAKDCRQPKSPSQQKGKGKGKVEKSEKSEKGNGNEKGKEKEKGKGKGGKPSKGPAKGKQIIPFGSKTREPSSAYVPPNKTGSSSTIPNSRPFVPLKHREPRRGASAVPGALRRHRRLRGPAPRKGPGRAGSGEGEDGRPDRKVCGSYSHIFFFFERHLYLFLHSKQD